MKSFFFFTFSCFLVACVPETKPTYLHLVEDEEQCGYINSKGDTIIPFGKYIFCFTDTFKTVAIVLSEKDGFIGIDRNEKALFSVFPFDNGPDDPSEGLFRIIVDDKIGYANLQGEIVIQPQFSCAYPFEKGQAKVSNTCQKIKDGEHTRWQSDSWFYIDKSGK